MSRRRFFHACAAGLGGIFFLIAIGAAFWQLERRGRLIPGDGCIQRGMLDTGGVLGLSADGVELAGWAYDESGVLSVEVVSDGRVIAKMSSPVERVDVAEALHACHAVNRAGFSIHVPAHAVPPEGGTLEVVARSLVSGVWSLGRVRVDTSRPFGRLDGDDLIRWNGRNHLSGWALASSENGGVQVRVKLEDGTVIAQGPTQTPRPDVGQRFPNWTHSGTSGFDLRLSMSDLPRGRYTMQVEAVAGERSTPIGTIDVDNAEIPGFLEAGKRVLIEPDGIDVGLFLLARLDEIADVNVRTETGEQLARLSPTSFGPFAASAPEALSLRARELGTGDPIAFAGRIDAQALPRGTWRLIADVERKAGGVTRIQGPIVKRGEDAVVDCHADPLRIFFPGGNYALKSGFPELAEQRALIEGGCVEVGLRARVEYLRSTLGVEHDYAFDSDLPDSLRAWKGKEMTGVSLHRLLEAAQLLDVPLLVTLDGGVWADSAFAVPEFDVVDMLEQDPTTVQWNQYGRAEPDDALSSLAGSIESPQLARMMSLNRFNTRFLAYKKRNLQSAVREIVAHMHAHPDRYVGISLDPDQYINPWFYLEQWYDYNPDAIRQYREWLFHQGPYADGAEWMAERPPARMTLVEASRLAGRVFEAIDEVEPPTGPIDYADRWQQIWTQFKRHLVARHYADLARWASEAGMPVERIFTGQTFIQADVATTVFERATGWTDQAGVSIEGAAPDHGRLGPILYGPASRNHGTPRSGLTLIDNIRAADPHWGSSEFHPATIEEPQRIPDHYASYLTVLEMTNGGARVLSPMWGTSGSDQLLAPRRFRAYDAYQRTPFETQFIWLLHERRAIAAGDMLFPFGNRLVSSLDRWQPTTGSEAHPQDGVVRVLGQSPGFRSPDWAGFAIDHGASITVIGNWGGSSVEALATIAMPGGTESLLIGCDEVAGRSRCDLPPRAGGQLARVELRWPAATEVVVDAVRIERPSPGQS